MIIKYRYQSPMKVPHKIAEILDVSVRDLLVKNKMK